VASSMQDFVTEATCLVLFNIDDGGAGEISDPKKRNGITEYAIRYVCPPALHHPHLRCTYCLLPVLPILLPYCYLIINWHDRVRLLALPATKSCCVSSVNTLIMWMHLGKPSQGLKLRTEGLKLRKAVTE
jgi:hypothetical protein